MLLPFQNPSKLSTVLRIKSQVLLRTTGLWINLLLPSSLVSHCVPLSSCSLKWTFAQSFIFLSHASLLSSFAYFSSHLSRETLLDSWGYSTSHGYSIMCLSVLFLQLSHFISQFCIYSSVYFYLLFLIFLICLLLKCIFHVLNCKLTEGRDCWLRSPVYYQHLAEYQVCSRFWINICEAWIEYYVFQSVLMMAQKYLPHIKICRVWI